jgi:hypothetical protein
MLGIKTPAVLGGGAEESIDCVGQSANAAVGGELGGAIVADIGIAITVSS